MSNRDPNDEEMEVEDSSSAMTFDRDDVSSLVDLDDAISVVSLAPMAMSVSPQKTRRRAFGQTPEPSTSTINANADDEGSVPDEKIRLATEKYLKGELSATEFASSMEEFDRWKTEGPSLVLLNQDEEMITLDDIVSPNVPEPPKPSTSQVDFLEKEARSLRGEFFETGDATATFSLGRRKKMPPTVKSMMGEAHVRFARGDLAGAESLCKEIIKEQPTYKDPFHTLAMIYESQADDKGSAQLKKKALQFFLISGLLEPKSFEEWPRLGEWSVTEGNLAQAIMCYKKAIISDPQNTKCYIRLAELLAELGDTRGALKGYERLLRLSSSDGPLFLSVAKKVAGLHFAAGKVELAYDSLNEAAVKFPTLISTVELNLLTEVCISLQKWGKGLKYFKRFGNVRFSPPLPEKSGFSLLNDPNRTCSYPADLHPDLVQKLAVILIHLKAFGMAEEIVATLQRTENLDSFGIQLFEIGEAYLGEGQFVCAFELFEQLVADEKYDKAEIWLRYAECLFLLNRLEESAEAYERVITLAPGHKMARLNLSLILQKLGRYEGALQSLNQHDMEEIIDQDLLVEKCNILLARNRIPEFYETALQLFSRHCPEIRDYDEAHALVITSQTNQMIPGLASLRLRKSDNYKVDLSRIDEVASELDRSPKDATSEFKVYLSLYKLMLERNRPDLLSRLSYTVWASALLSRDRRIKREMDIQVALATILNGDSELAHIHVRSLMTTYGLSSMMLAIVSLAMKKCGHSRFVRQCLRLLMKRPGDTRLMMLSAHSSFMNGTYRYALMEYFALLQHRPEDPLIHLMIATTLIHIATQRANHSRSQLTIQAVAFINSYAKLRGDCQETAYNLGRFYHYIGFTKEALHYYKKALSTPPVNDFSCMSDPSYNINDLRREIGFNIGQIYKAANCWGLAKKYIHRYCVV